MLPDLRLSVIIPVYNGAQTLIVCLQALHRQTRPPDEIIVVDDGSSDDSAGVAAQYRVRVLRQRNAGPAAARNYGARVAGGDVLLFTDADCVPAPDWVEQMARVMADPTIAGAKGVYRTRQRNLVARFVQQEYQDRYDRMTGQPRIDFVDTYSAAYRRSVFLAAGGFDTGFPTASVEDQELSFRLAAQGQRLVYVPEARVCHRHDRTPEEYARRKYGIGYWKAVVTQRYPAKLAHDSHTPQVLKAQMGLVGLGAALLLGALATGSRAVGAIALLAWALFFLSGGPFYLKIARRDTPVLAVAPLLLLVRAVALSLGFFWGNLRLVGRRYLQANENHKF